MGPPGEPDAWWKVTRAIVRPLLRLAFRLRVAGTHHLPTEGPAILAPNHVSVLDPILVGMVVDAQGRTTRFLAAAELFRKPLIGLFLRRLRQIPVRRGRADRPALDEIAAVIRGGELTGVFPEGRMGDGRDLLPGQKGLARIALLTGAPVIPVGVWGTQERWPRTGLRLRRPLRPKVGVVFGQPIEAAGDPRSPRDVRRLTERVMADIAGAVEGARRLAAS